MLLVAAANGSNRVLQELVSKVSADRLSDLNKAQNMNGIHPLAAAAATNQSECLEILLRTGASLAVRHSSFVIWHCHSPFVLFAFTSLSPCPFPLSLCSFSFPPSLSLA